MRWWQQRGLHFKLALGVNLTMLIALEIAFYSASEYIRAQLWRREVQAAESLNAATATWLEDAMMAGRKDRIQEVLFPELIGSMDPSVVLHGDLHHWNILRAEREPWLALDPKSVVGEPAYEVGALLRNPMPYVSTWPRLGQILDRRVGQLAEILEFDRARLVSWGIAQAVLSAWWSIEDHGHGGESAIAVAQALANLQRA